MYEDFYLYSYLQNNPTNELTLKIVKDMNCMQEFRILKKDNVIVVSRKSDDEKKKGPKTKYYKLREDLYE